MEFVVFSFFGFALFLIYLSAISGDKDRIEKEINAKGGKLLFCKRATFRDSVASDRDERVYKINYIDNEGN